MSLNNFRKFLIFFHVLLFMPVSLLAQGTEIAMERLSETFRIIGNVALVVALINLVLFIVYWITNKKWLAAPLLFFSVPSVLFGLAGYRDDPWIAKIALASGSLAILLFILRAFFRVRF